MPPISSKYATDNWCVVVELSSYEKAVAFRELIAGLDIVGLATRPKNQHASHGNVANWRMTARLREQLIGNSFTREDVQIAVQLAGYSKWSSISWLTNATAVGLIRRLEKGVYEFTPNADGSTEIGVVTIPDAQRTLPDALCVHCQPPAIEALSCP